MAHPTVPELDAARLLLATALAMDEANEKRCGTDAIELPDPKGDMEPWRIITCSRPRNGVPTICLKLKPARGAYCYGKAAITNSRSP